MNRRPFGGRVSLYSSISWSSWASVTFEKLRSMPAFFICRHTVVRSHFASSAISLTRVARWGENASARNSRSICFVGRPGFPVRTIRVSLGTWMRRLSLKKYTSGDCLARYDLPLLTRYLQTLEQSKLPAGCQPLLRHSSEPTLHQHLLRTVKPPVDGFQ